MVGNYGLADSSSPEAIPSGVRVMTLAALAFLFDFPFVADRQAVSLRG